MSRRTIHYWMVSGQLDRDFSAGRKRYGARPPVAHKLDPYAEIIGARLEEFRKLSAQQLFEEVRAVAVIYRCVTATSSASAATATARDAVSWSVSDLVAMVG